MSINLNYSCNNEMTKISKVKKMSNVKEIGNSKSYVIQYRVFDILFSLGAIFILSPILIIVSILLKLSSPKTSIFFVQKRLGLNGKLFNVYKFKTMIPNAEEELEKILSSNKKLRDEYLTFRKLKDDPRIIPKIGSFLRKTSLDELPQFFNVLFGQMSVVGPRPYIKNEFDIYPTEYELMKVTGVKPGVTGYWQIIPERHDTTFRNRVMLDIEYIEKKTFLLDLYIIWKTLVVVTHAKGA